MTKIKIQVPKLHLTQNSLKRFYHSFFIPRNQTSAHVVVAEYYIHAPPVVSAFGWFVFYFIEKINSILLCIVQCRIKKVNRKALFNGCISHSVNLCGTHSFSVNASCVTFFGSMESLYTFFSGSTSRWERLKEYASVTVKRIVETRWSASFEVVKQAKHNPLLRAAFL